MNPADIIKFNDPNFVSQFLKLKYSIVIYIYCFYIQYKLFFRQKRFLLNNSNLTIINCLVSI